MILSKHVRQTAIDVGKAMLAERPNRGRDLERENAAFRALIDQFARDPKKLLEKLCEEVIDLLDAGSSGVSLLQLRSEGDGIFHWPAIAGQWKGFVGGQTPRNASPCGVVCDCGAVLLFQNPEIIFTATAGISPAMEDLLVAPFFINGAPAGTVWAIHHDKTKKFDQEDARLLQNLSQFASAAHQAELNEARTIATNAARAASEAELRFALRAGRLGAWRLDLATGALVTSPTCRTNFGRDPDAPFSYSELRGAIFPDDQERMAAAVEFSIATRADYDIEYRIVTPSGEVRWVQIRGQPEYDANGAAVAINGVSLDVTAPKESEVALRRAETRLRELNEMLEQRIADVLEERKVYADIVESSASAVTALDRDYRILAINRSNIDAFERVFGKRPKPGDDFLSLFEDAPEHKSQQLAIWSRALNGETFNVLEEFGNARIERRSFEVRFSPLLNSKGERIGASSTSNDVTDRVLLAAAQEQLRQAQKVEALGQLTGGVAHDFNNLLTPIVGGLDMLKRRGVFGARERRLLEAASESAERARTLVQRLLAFARSQPLQVVAVNAAALIPGMARLFESTIGPRVRLAIDIEEDLPGVLADANQLEMALLNLGLNARDAMPEGGELRISARAEQIALGHRSGLRPDAYVRLDVTDTGVGMDQATIDRATEPFFSTKGVGQGTGLGLSMVDGLARQLGGAVYIESAPGHGTCVHIWVRATTMAEPPVAPPSRDVEGRGGGVVLLVDDEIAVRAMTADMLAELGYEVEECGSAADALQRVRAGFNPDIVLTDHLMPEMTGSDLAQMLAREHPKIPVLIMSGYAKAAGLAPDSFVLTEPFRIEELDARLAQMRG